MTGSPTGPARKRRPALPETQPERRGHPFYPTAEDGLPPLYGTERTKTADKVIRAHYFVGACNWWLAEYDPAEGLAFGYACLGDPQNAEWGYASLPELETISAGPGGLFIVERDLHWVPTPFREVVDHQCGGGLYLR